MFQWKSLYKSPKTSPNPVIFVINIWYGFCQAIFLYNNVSWVRFIKENWHNDTFGFWSVVGWHALLAVDHGSLNTPSQSPWVFHKPPIFIRWAFLWISYIPYPLRVVGSTPRCIEMVRFVFERRGRGSQWLAGSLVPQSGIEPRSLQWGRGDLITGLPGNSFPRMSLFQSGLLQTPQVDSLDVS